MVRVAAAAADPTFHLLRVSTEVICDGFQMSVLTFLWVWRCFKTGPDTLSGPDILLHEGKSLSHLPEFQLLPPNSGTGTVSAQMDVWSHGSGRITEVRRLRATLAAWKWRFFTALQNLS